MTIEKLKLGLAIWITALFAVFCISFVIIGRWVVETYHKQLELISIGFLLLVMFIFITAIIYSFITDPEYWKGWYEYNEDEDND